MAVARFSVLLRNGSHRQLAYTKQSINNNWGLSGSSGQKDGTQRYGVALKCDNVSISYSKTPIQIPIPQRSPEIIDLGIFRPSITLSGLVENGGTGTDPFMEFVDVASKTSEYSEEGSGNQDTYTARYYLPYKNVMENIIISWINKNSTDIECQIGDMDVPTGSYATGGANYKVAIQQGRFQQNAAQEDRWQFTMQLIAKAREDYIF